MALGSYSGSGFPPSLTNPNIPAIFVGTQDSGMFRLYGGTQDGGATYIVRWEGVNIYTQGVSYANVNKIWEAVFYQANPSRVTLKTQNGFWNGQGVTYIKNSNTQLYPESGSLNIISGGYVTLDAVVNLQIAANSAVNIGGKTNLASNSLTLPGCPT